MLGKNLSFYGYNATDDTAGGKSSNCSNPDFDKAFNLTDYSFNFDGVNDYIKIQYDNTVLSNEKIKDGNGNDTANYKTQKQVFAENGFTFEFYGKFDSGNWYKSDGFFSNEYDYLARTILFLE